MAKVVYSISRRNWNSKMTGVADLSDGTLCIRTRKGREMVFEDILKYCHPIPDRPNQYKGYMTLAYEDVPVYRRMLRLGTDAWQSFLLLRLCGICS